MNNLENPSFHRHPCRRPTPIRWRAAAALLVLACAAAAATAADPKPASPSAKVKAQGASPPAKAASAAAPAKAASAAAPAKAASAAAPATAASAAAPAAAASAAAPAAAASAAAPAAAASAAAPAAAASAAAPAAAASAAAPAAAASAAAPAAAASAAAPAPPAREAIKPETEQDKALNDDLIAAAEVMVRRSATGGIKLDYSPGSIEIVEQQLGGLYNDLRNKRLEPPPTDSEIRETAFLFGMYIAEVIRRKHGGSWSNQSALYPGKEVLTFHAGVNHIDLWPQFKVEQRLKNGPQDNVWNYFQAAQRQLDVKKE